MRNWQSQLPGGGSGTGARVLRSHCGGVRLLVVDVIWSAMGAGYPGCGRLGQRVGSALRAAGVCVSIQRDKSRYATAAIPVGGCPKGPLREEHAMSKGFYLRTVAAVTFGVLASVANAQAPSIG